MRILRYASGIATAIALADGTAPTGNHVIVTATRSSSDSRTGLGCCSGTRTSLPAR